MSVAVLGPDMYENRSLIIIDHGESDSGSYQLSVNVLFERMDGFTFS